MTTPTAVKKAAAEADAFIRKLSEKPTEADTPAVEEPQEQVEIEEEVAEAEPLTVNAPEPDAADEEDEDEEDEPRGVAALREELSLVEQRYRSLQGMFNKQVETINTLNALIANMQAPPVQAAQSKEPDPADDDAETFGSDIVSMARRQARAEFSKEIKALRDELAAVQGNVNHVRQDTEQVKRAGFEKTVSAAVDELTGGRFAEINMSPEFQQWVLGSQDAPSAYRQLFQAAIQAQDVDKVLSFFRAYAIDNNMLTGKQQVITSEPPREDPRLAKQVAPGKSRGTPTAADKQGGEKRMWTMTGIQNFMRDKIAGKYPKETADKLERDVFAAQREGRVDYTK